jgi:hypothetical protein
LAIFFICINQAAKAIHAIDPNHPVMTVIGTSMMEMAIFQPEICHFMSGKI